ncbi:hypothetical protein PO124_02580 [Bacillus licheniformis]|nr:hypothetical protein [Bacillus licheniformis]
MPISTREDIEYAAQTAAEAFKHGQSGCSAPGKNSI